MYILITGSRNASGQLLMKVQEFIRDNPDHIYIVGDASGVDNIAIKSCDAYKRIVVVHGAYKKVRFSSTTGKNLALDMDYLARDRYMVEQYPIGMCVAFWDGKSRGTKYTMRKAYDKGVKVVLYRDSGVKEYVPPQS